MAFSPGDPVSACARVQNALPRGETDTNKRIHRGTIATADEWNIGDTVKVKKLADSYRYFGYMDADDLTDEVILTGQDGTVIASSTAGQGSSDVTVTLDAAGPTGEDIVVCYRVGVPATYVDKCHDRNQVKIDCHDVTLDGGDQGWLAVFNQNHPWGASFVVKEAVQVDGQSIQSIPPV